MLPIASTPLGTPPARAILCLFVLVPVGVSIAAFSVAMETAEWYLSEDGPIEQLSPILWFILAIFSIGLFGVRNLTAWAIGVLGAAAGLREMDLHKSITDEHMLRIGFYLGDEQTIQTRLICGLIVGLILASAVVLVVRGWQRFRTLSLRALPSWAWIMLMTVVALGVSKVFDRSIAMFEDIFGFDMDDRMKLAIHAFEETIEMLLPIGFGAAMMCLSLVPGRRSDTVESGGDGRDG